MKAKVLFQENTELGQHNLCFVTDPTANFPGDFLVRGGSWDRAKLTVGEIYIDGAEHLLELIANQELRSITSELTGAEAQVAYTDEQVAQTNALITQHYDRDLNMPLEDDQS